MDFGTLFIILILLVGFYMSWNIGANDVSNAMGTSVGSGALTLKQAVIIAAVLEFSGAFFLGSNVSETIQTGIVSPEFFANDPQLLVIGMFSALLATSFWLQIASYFGWPVSTTHAIVGAILGFGLLVGGFQAIHWSEVGSVALSWVISPTLSGLLAFLLFSLLQKKVLYAMNPILAAKKLAPILTFFLLLIFVLGTGADGIKRFHFYPSIFMIFIAAIVIGLIGAFVAHFLISRMKIFTKTPSSGSLRGSAQIASINKAIKHLNRMKIISSGDTRTVASESISRLEALTEELKSKVGAKPQLSSDYRMVERIFAGLQIVSACFVAFAHGANDVANAIGPVGSVVQVILHPNSIGKEAILPLWLLALGGTGIVIGLATWGWRVIETIGKKITELTPSRGFCAEFAAATTILIASKFGMPISTTHCIVGAVLGIGLAKGLSAINLRCMRDIALSWVVTIPSSAIACILIFYVVKMLVEVF